MKYGSLFSGIGGFDLAFDRAGMECAWQCEIDKQAGEVLAHHWPNVKNIGDVRNVGRNTVEYVDLICGGFPCQDVSFAGKRAGLAGKRSGLWFEFARIIDELKPGWVVIENVPGLLSSNRGQDFAVIIQRLAECGYGVAWRVLDAQYFGVPQRRRRVFIVGSLGSGCAAEVLFECESVCRDIEKGGAGRETDTGTFTMRAGKEGGGKGYLGADGLSLPLCGQSVYAVDARQTTVSGEITSTLQASAGHHGYSFNAAPLVMAHGQANAEIVEGSSPSLTCNHEAPIVFGTSIRRLTPLECERLQGFPDGWTAGQSDAARYRQLGNAVAVPVVEWIGKRIMEANK